MAKKYNPYSVRAKRATILFWIVVTVFVATAILAIIAVANSLGLIRLPNPPYKDLYIKLVWALWVSILAEGAGIFFMLSKDLLGLATEPKITELRNTLGEVVDGLEANGDLSSEKANGLRAVLGPQVAEVNPVLSRGG